MILSLSPDGNAGVEAQVFFALGGLVVEEVFEADHPVEIGGEGGVELGADDGEVLGSFSILALIAWFNGKEEKGLNLPQVERWLVTRNPGS